MSSAQSMQMNFTMGPSISEDPYHIPIVRSQLTRNIATIFPDLRDEVATAFTDLLDLKGDGEFYCESRDSLDN